MYTTEQRLKIYQRMLSESLSPTELEYAGSKRLTNDCGFCFMWKMLCFIDKDKNHRTYNALYNDFEGTLPELYEKSDPYSNGAYSFRDWYHREEALAKCIVEMQEGSGIV